ncbi:MAG: hypothetical protein JNK04_14145 [Myxococcales bacterium]|nr:hypothetical protein [Myxococcales bacterium]
MLTLHDNAFSPFAPKVRLVLDHKRLPYDVVDGLSPKNHPTRLNATVACDDMAITFEALAPGTYTYVAEHADSGVGFEGNPVEVEGDVVVGPIDLMPLD